MDPIPEITTEKESFYPKLPKKGLKATASIPDIFHNTSKLKNQEAFLKLYNGATSSDRYGKINRLRGFYTESLNSKLKSSEVEISNNELPQLQDHKKKRLVVNSENYGKKISCKDLMDFKREIFKSRLSIDIKKESTKKLEEYLSNEESTLNARISDMESDYAWIRHYIQMLGDELIRLVNEGKELDQKRQLQNKDLVKLKNEVFRVEIEIGEIQENIKIHSSFKEFIELVIKNGHTKKYEKVRDDVEARLLAEISEARKNLPAKGGVQKPASREDATVKKNLLELSPSKKPKKPTDDDVIYSPVTPK